MATPLIKKGDSTVVLNGGNKFLVQLKTKKKAEVFNRMGKLLCTIKADEEFKVGGKTFVMREDKDDPSLRWINQSTNFEKEKDAILRRIK
jgi:hypothetical protein